MTFLWWGQKTENLQSSGDRKQRITIIRGQKTDNLQSLGDRKQTTYNHQGTENRQLTIIRGQKTDNLQSSGDRKHKLQSSGDRKQTTYNHHFSLVGTENRQLTNMTVLSSGHFINIYADKVLLCFASELLRVKPNVGLLFTNKERTRLTQDKFDAFAPHSHLVHEVIDTNCWAQNGSSHGYVFTTFKHQLLTNRVRN